MQPLGALGCAERGALKFTLARQPCAPPSRKGARFGVAYVGGPREGQRDQLEHAAPEPVSVVELPEQRMCDPLASGPFPILRTPPLGIRVPAGVHKLEEHGVGHVVTLDRKGGNVLPGLPELVVPSERDRAAVHAKRRAAGGDVNPLGGGRRSVPPPPAGPPAALIPCEALPHVKQ